MKLMKIVIINDISYNEICLLKKKVNLLMHADIKSKLLLKTLKRYDSMD